MDKKTKYITDEWNNMFESSDEEQQKILNNNFEISTDLLRKALKINFKTTLVKWPRNIPVS